MGVNVVETEEAGLRKRCDPRGAGGGSRERQRTSRGPATAGSGQVRGQGTRRPHRRPRAHLSPRNGIEGAPFARGRGRRCQARRGWPRGNDCGTLREPAHLPGHHHLAGRAQRGEGLAVRHHRCRRDLCRARREGRAATGDQFRWPVKRQHHRPRPTLECAANAGADDRARDRHPV